MATRTNADDLHEHALREAEALRRMVEEISSELELRPLLTRIVTHACDLLGADDGSIGLFDPVKKVIRTEAVCRMPVREVGAETGPGVGLAGAAMGLSAIVLLGVAFMTVVRSPFRAPPQDRLFQAIWLGPIGRTLVRLSARGVSRTAAKPVVSRPALTPITPPPVAAPPTDRLAELEARLAALEKRQG
jgi:hypothetical protein